MATSVTLPTKRTVYYHGGCQDGFCSAWLMHRVQNFHADFCPVTHSDPPPKPAELTGHRIWILDFCFKSQVLLDILPVAAEVNVFDHHHTSTAELAQVEKNKSSRYDLKVVFDEQRSGAMITLDHCDTHFAEFFGPESNIVDYVQDRDLWKWQLPKSKEINAALASYPMEFAVWDHLDSLLATKEGETRLVQDGEAIIRYQKHLVNRTMDRVQEIKMDGHKILCVNTTVLPSEVGELLAINRPFSATYSIDDKKKTKTWQLRSQSDSGIDVSEIAKKRGGGGHRHAAGFVEPLS